MQSEPRTIPAMYLQRVEKDLNRTALFIKQDGTYEPIIWGQLRIDVCKLAISLSQQGVKPGDRVVQFSENRYEWILADLAIQLLQAIHVPIHAPLTGAQVLEQVGDSGATVVIVSTGEMLKKVADHLDGTKEFVFLTHDEVTIDAGVESSLAVPATVEIDEAEAERIENACRDELDSDSISTILYTSGTTGEPKGVVLSQHNLVSNTTGALQTIGMREDDLRLGFLPLSHIFARTCDLYTWIGAGSRFALAESRDTVVADAQAIKPTVLNGVPYFFELLRRALVAHGKENEPGALKALLGGEIRMFCSGGAALPDHLYDYYESQEVPIMQGYGLTETSPVISVSGPMSTKRGASGKPIPGVEVAIADDGEIITRGPHVMVGYWNKPEATSEVIRDGWFHTGDLGRIDEEGFVYITGRKKELIVTAAGKNIAPVLIESLLTEDPKIAQALVIGDDRSYLTALIVVSTEKLVEELADRGANFDASDPISCDAATQLFEEAIATRLKDLSHHEQVRKFTLLADPFTIEKGEMTPKLSLRREVISKNYASAIEKMYAK